MQQTHSTDHEKARVRRAERYRLRAVAQTITQLPRVRRCGEGVIGKNGVALVVAEGVAHFKGVARCSNVHACPVCGPKIRQARAEEIDILWGRHSGTGGGGELVTFTVGHHRRNSLQSVMGWLRGGRSRVFESYRWSEDRARFGIVGTVAALEVTRSDRNGWHPHVHVLVFTERPLTDGQRRDLAARMWERFEAGARAEGCEKLSRRHGIDVRPVTAGRSGEMGAYLTGFSSAGVAQGPGLEVARADVKRGRVKGSRSVGQILEDVARWGDKSDAMLWREYEMALSGRRSIVFSRGLRKLFEVVELTDDEISEAPEPGEVVWVFSVRQWIRVRCYASLLLDAAEISGVEGVRSVLAAAGEPVSAVPAAVLVPG